MPKCLILFSRKYFIKYMNLQHTNNIIFMSLPSLPPNDTPHSSNLHNAVQILHSHYETTRAVLSSGNHNRHRLQHHAHLIFNDTLPLLLVLEEEVRKDKALVDWLQEVSERFLGLTTHLLDAEAEAGGEK